MTGHDDGTTDGTGLELDRRSLIRAAGATAGAGLAGVGASGAATADPQYGPRYPAEVDEGIEKPTATRTFPVYDYRDGEYVRDGSRTWRTIKDTGNCCENYLASSPDGRIFDMGGDYLRVTADDGETFTEISAPGPYPYAASEGAVSAAPNGDVVVMDWEPYSGDHVVTYKYVAEEDTWYYAESPVKTPFYDRPWLVVVPGPFTVAGEEIPYIVIQRGGYPSDDELYVSFDGLNYVYASTRFVEGLVNGTVEEYLDFGEEDAAMLDWVQPHTETFINPLGGGRAIADESVASAEATFFEFGCEHAILGAVEGDTVPGSDLQWACFDTPTGYEKTRTQTDGKGRIHQVEFPTETEFVYRVSEDGGETWARHRQPMPGDYRLASGLALYDFKVFTTEAKEAGVEEDVVAIAVHATFTPDEEGSLPEPVEETAPEPVKETAEKAEEEVKESPVGPGEDGDGDDVEQPDVPADQDMLFRLSDVDASGRAVDPDVEVSFVGAADVSYVSGFNTAERFDFSTVAVEPDGRVVMSFADTTDSNPMMAIELDEKPPVEDLERFVMPGGERLDDGSVFTGGQTNRIELTVYPNLVPAEGATVVVRDVIPIEWDVVGGDVSEADVTVDEAAGVKYLDLGTLPGDGEGEYTYFAEAPSGAGATGQYQFGPAEIEYDGAWHDAENTSDTNRVVGASTNTDE